MGEREGSDEEVEEEEVGVGDLGEGKVGVAKKEMCDVMRNGSWWRPVTTI